MELATSPSGQVLSHLWRGWPGDTLHAEAAHEYLYNWAQEVLSYSQGIEGRKVVNALLVQIIRRPRGADGLWPGDALRRLLEDAGFLVGEIFYTGYTRQFKSEWLETQARIQPGPDYGRLAWGLLLRTAFAAPARKYDSIRVHAVVRE